MFNIVTCHCMEWSWDVNCNVFIHAKR